MKKFYTIPIFIPEDACPHRCSYCNQYHITNQTLSPAPQEVVATVEQYLKTIPFQNEDIRVKIAFFGGSFTGLPWQKQEQYLQAVQPYIESQQVDSIQLSTRPDYIDETILRNLKQYHVSLIELGTPSMDPEVLWLAQRGHTVEDIRRSAQLITTHQFELGVQMMIGLPGDTAEKSFFTSLELIKLGGTHARIYPTLVIKGTLLERLYLAGKYTPLSLEEAVAWCVPIYKEFESHQVTILRIGLHPSEGLIHQTELVAGPFHVSFKELVLTEIWKERLLAEAKKQQGDTFQITVPREEINYAVGYQSSNRKWLEKRYKKVNFLISESD